MKISLNQKIIDFIEYYNLNNLNFIMSKKPIKRTIKTSVIAEDSEIIVPSNTFIATSEAVTRSGLKVVFADCNPRNYTISLESILKKITNKTRAIIAVHLYGHPADMDGISEIIKSNTLVGYKAKYIKKGIIKMMNVKKNWKNPYGESVSKKILKILIKQSEK